MDLPGYDALMAWIGINDHQALLEVARAFLTLEGGSDIFIDISTDSFPIAELLQNSGLKRITLDEALKMLRTGKATRSVVYKTAPPKSLALALTYPLEAVVKVVWVYGDHTTVFGGPLVEVLEHCYMLPEDRILLAMGYKPNGETLGGPLREVIAFLRGGNRAIA